MKVEFFGGPIDGRTVITKALDPDFFWVEGKKIYHYRYKPGEIKAPIGPNSVLRFECLTEFKEPQPIEATREEKISLRMKEVWAERKAKSLQ